MILGKAITNNTKIYRTIKKGRLLQMFATRENALVRPKLWDDPFENLALNSQILFDDEVGTFDFKDDIYGQCWTLESFSDAMWRIYSNGTDGIRIRTTVGKLLESLVITEPQYNATSCFIGKVRYCRDEELNNFADTHFADGLGDDGKKIAETLLLKRNAFRHEDEVRLIYFSPQSQPFKKDLHRYQFDPNKIIDQIMLHPQLTLDEVKSAKVEIRKRTGWKGKLKHSLLYRLPKGFRFKVGV